MEPKTDAKGPHGCSESDLFGQLLNRRMDVSSVNSSPTASIRRASNYGELLYQEAAVRAASRKAQKEVQEIQQEEYPFQPTISDLARSLPSTEPVEQRLEQLAMERQRRLEQLQMMHRQEQERQNTFQPAINQAFPLQDRPSDFLESVERQEHRRAVKLATLAAEAQEQHKRTNTYRPAISDYSRSLQRSEPVHERLYSIAKSKAEQQQEQVEPTEAFDPATGQRLFTPAVSSVNTSRDGSVQDELYKVCDSRVPMVTAYRML